MANLFWTRWKKVFTNVTSKNKVELSLNVILNWETVLIKDDKTVRNNSPLARITKVMTDKNGFVHSVALKTSSSSLERPIDKLVLLMENNED